MMIPEQHRLAALRADLVRLVTQLREVVRSAAPVPDDGIPRTLRQEIAGLEPDELFAEVLDRLGALAVRTDEEVEAIYRELAAAEASSQVCAE